MRSDRYLKYVLEPSLHVDTESLRGEGALAICLFRLNISSTTLWKGTPSAVHHVHVKKHSIKQSRTRQDIIEPHSFRGGRTTPIYYSKPSTSASIWLTHLPSDQTLITSRFLLLDTYLSLVCHRYRPITLLSPVASRCLRREAFPPWRRVHISPRLMAPHSYNNNILIWQVLGISSCQNRSSASHHRPTTLRRDLNRRV